MSNKIDLNAILAVQLGRTYNAGTAGKSAYEIWLEQGNEGKSEAEFLASLRSADALPYGGSKEWLEENGDPTQLYQIDGYIWAYTEASGWTKSGAQFRVVSTKDSMTGENGTPYLLRQGNVGTVYAFTPASGDMVDSEYDGYDKLPEYVPAGTLVGVVGGNKYEAVDDTLFIPHNAFDPDSVEIDTRINGSGGEVTQNGYVLLKDYIPVTYDKTLSFTVRDTKGQLSLGSSYSSQLTVAFYNQAKECLGIKTSGYYSGYVSNGALPITVNPFDYSGAAISNIDTAAYIRVTLVVGDDNTSASAVDYSGLVVNFPHLDETRTISAWEDRGAYIPYQAAHWSATEETYVVTDTLDGTAHSGETAVYAVDGYLYTYMSEDGWMAQSRYTPPALSLDSQLSDTSTFAVQNRVITSAIMAEQAKIQKNTDDIVNLKGQVEGLSAENGFVILPDVWKEAADACVATVKALQAGKNCVTFPFFSDNHQRLGSVGRLIGYVMRECGIPYAFFGGDAITSGAPVTTDPDSEFMRETDEFASVMSYIPEGRLCRAVGNHEHYLKYRTEEGGTTLTRTYTRDQVYDTFLRGDGVAQTKHFGEDGTYYYVDDLPSKVRWIVLNTNPFTLVSAGAEVIDDTQLAWLQSTALSFSESGWGVVFISHCPISSHYHANVRNAAAVVSMLKDYAGGSDPNKAEIIGWFSGHIHRDRIYTHLAVNSGDGIEGEDGEELGFTQVVITADANLDYDRTSGTPGLDRDMNGDTSHAIDFVTVNRTTGEVNLTRLGFGEDRSYTYK